MTGIHPILELRAWWWKRHGVPTLWGDGWHDDTKGVQAWVDGKPVRGTWFGVHRISKTIEHHDK